MSGETSLPQYDLPEVIGEAMSATKMAQFITQAVRETAEGLHASKLVVLSFLTESASYRVGAAYHLDNSGIANRSFSHESFPAGEQALRTGLIRIIPPPLSQLPEVLRPHFEGEVFLIPVMIGERRLALLLGEGDKKMSLRSPEWQSRAMEIASRNAILIELSRTASAYQNELEIRMAGQTILSSILEGRPLPEIAEEIVEFVSQRLKANRIGMFLYKDDSHFQPLALQNISSQYGEEVSRVSTISPYLRRAKLTSKPYHGLNVQEDPEASEEQKQRFKRENITSILMTPLLLGDALKGTLVLYPDEGRTFTPSELSLLQNFAAQATMAIAITQQMSQERNDATIEERNRLAREIHDTVASSLTSIVIQVKTVETALKSGNEALALTMISEAIQNSAKALNETRRAVYGMIPESVSRQTASQSIEEESANFARETGIETPFIRTGIEVALSADVRLAALRIAQEALQNAKKHSKAKRVRIGLQFTSETLILIIEDDGVGFDPAVSRELAVEGGYGLFGMNERARLLGGDVQIESVPGWGTRIRANLPYKLPETSRHESSRATSKSPFPPPPSPTETALSTTPPASSTERIMPVGKLRVVIADDHLIVRNGIKTALEMEGSIQIVGEASDGEQAFQLTKSLKPDVVLMDLQMPGVDGLEGLKRIHASTPETPVVILTTFFNETSVAECLRAGARGYLLKDATPEEIIDALRAAFRGEAHLSHIVSDSLANLAGASAGKVAVAGVNDREREVLQLVAQGARNKEIAASLFITVSTVEKHIASLFHKLEATNRAELVRSSIARGLVFPGSQGR